VALTRSSGDFLIELALEGETITLLAHVAAAAEPRPILFFSQRKRRRKTDRFPVTDHLICSTCSQPGELLPALGNIVRLLRSLPSFLFLSFSCLSPRQHAPDHSPTFNDDCVYRQTTPFSLLPLLIATPFLRSPPPYFDFDTCYVCTTRSWSNANHAQISWRNGRGVGSRSIKTIDPPY
jgi:hypothetical protein